MVLISLFVASIFRLTFMNYSLLIARFYVLGLPSNFSIVTKQFANCYQTIPKLFANGLLPASPQVYHERLAVAARDGLAVGGALVGFLIRNAIFTVFLVGGESETHS